MKSKIRPLVNVNINPCKMCMPMGNATAFYGLKECMTILHGSQGCATYIRRHMATHYNEPVDIASSSLTEQGTVYGGSRNLKKGLGNLIELYHPKVVGVMTTCLAETIGEDIVGIIEEFYEENPQYKDIVIIPSPSPGYGGTQYEGYFQALYAIVSAIPMNTQKNDYINIITAPMSPADTRYIKRVCEKFDLKIILLPDLSDNLDGSHEKEYDRLPGGGTDICEISQMAGARFTIELTAFGHKNSVGKYLEEKYGVACQQINMPIGLRDTDAFLKLLSKLSGKEIPRDLMEERGRYLDAMIDSHKYNATGRAVVFGEPDYVVSTVRMLCESGVMPIVCATGSACGELKPLIEGEIRKLADMYYIDDFAIMDQADFKDIEEAARKHQANIMIGNSDGRRVAAELKIPIIRRGFPIHDHIGGQRLKMTGYQGSLQYLDEITNGLIETVENTFRENLYDRYYKDTLIDSHKEYREEMMEEKQEMTAAELLKKKTEEHPCYNCGAHKYARIHLPVAPMCNVQCNYCLRKFDCANESRPGVTSDILTPQEALDRYRMVKEKMSNLTVVGIAGPGDALANWANVKETFELIKAYDPDVTFCLSTNGLLLPEYADELAGLEVSHVTVTLNAVDPHISGQIYKYIQYRGKQYEGDAAGAVMIANQLAGIRSLVEHNVLVKINIVTVRGVNDEHVREIVKTVKDMGCFITNIMQMIPVKGTGFEHVEPISNKELQVIRKGCEEIMPQMYHCQHCRADAVGTLDHDISIDIKGFAEEKKEIKAKEQEKTVEKTRVAVASKSGLIVDTHFGQAKEFYIYDYQAGEVRYVEKRSVEQYCNGKEGCGIQEDKMTQIFLALEGCDAVIAMRTGTEPQRKLAEQGIASIDTYDRIEDAVKNAAISFAVAYK